MTSSPPPRRVLVHGFGEYAVIYHHLMQMAAREAPHLSFAVILPTSHHLNLIRQDVPEDRLLNLEALLQKSPPPVSDLSDLAAYHGSIHADIEAEKKTFKHRTAAFQTARAVEIYRLYKAFLERVRPDYILLCHVEGFEQKMLESLGRELGIPVGVPTDLRTIGGSFLSQDTQETLPMKRPVTAELLAKAKAFVEAFRQHQKPAWVSPLTEEMRGRSLSRHRQPFKRRVFGFIRRFFAHPDQFEWDHVRAAILNNLPKLRDGWWALKTRRAARWHDLSALEGLPEKFIYYPLHFTPESSINTPAPYLVDQLRVIDLLRQSMPSDHWLIVKDHWACIMLRRKSLIDAIRRSSGVQVIRYDMPGRALIERAALTVSVTGTSTLEAFLLGKPAITLGGNFASELLGGVTPVSDLPQRIRSALANPPSKENVVHAVAGVMAISRPFTIFSVSHEENPVYCEGNIRYLFAALLDDLQARSNIRAC